MIWSTTVVAVNRPCALHRTHKGCFRRYALLSRCHLLPYPRLAADGRSGCKGLCSSQYAPSVSLGQPGCLHGFSAFLGIADTSFGHNKSRCGNPQRLFAFFYSSIITHIGWLCKYSKGFIAAHHEAFFQVRVVRLPFCA